jgi:hypothetical protein
MRKLKRKVIAVCVLVCSAALVIFLLVGVYNWTHSMKTIHTYNEQDAALVHQVEMAVEKRIAPSDIEAFVGAKAPINTWRTEFTRSSGDRVNMAGDPPLLAGPIKIHSAKKVMGWPRPVQLKDGNTRYVGILWDENDNETVFAGTLLH